MNEEPKNHGAFATITTLFFTWGFITSVIDPLIPSVKAVFSLNYTESMLTTFAFFLACGVSSLPGGMFAARLSENFYWQRQDERGKQRLNALGPQSVKISARAVGSGEELVVRVRLEDRGARPALADKRRARKQADSPRVRPRGWNIAPVSTAVD